MIESTINLTTLGKEQISVITERINKQVIPIIDNIIKKQGFITDNDVARLINWALDSESLPITWEGSKIGFIENPVKKVENNQIFIKFKKGIIS